MRIVLPKTMRGYTYYRLTSVEFNDFDVERLLPSLFYLVVTRGRGRGRRPNDASAFATYLDALLAHPGMQGFDDAAGRRVLGRWLRSSVFQIGRAGRAHSREQIDYVQPLTLLAYKTGFPSEVRRQRNVHRFIYERLCQTERQAAGVEQARAAVALSDLFVAAFGRGLVIGGGPEFNGTYNGFTLLDIESLLSVHCLDGFQPTPVSAKDAGEEHGPALPTLAGRLGYDLLAYIRAYQGELPVAALAAGLMTLLNVELLSYTRQLFYATNELAAEGHRPALMDGDPAPRLAVAYVDFTRDRGHDSDRLARASVERDLEEMGLFLDSLMNLLTLDRLVQRTPRLSGPLAGQATPDYLVALRALQDHPLIEAAANADLDVLQHEALDACAGAAEQQEVRTWIQERCQDPDAPSLRVLVGMLLELQRKQASNSLGQWFWSVGGLRKPYGLLQGNLSGRRNWRYAMSDDLLRTLVQLALADDPTGALDHVSIKPRLKLSQFLDFLENRFGLLVARPPDFLDNPTGRAAAAGNLAALKRRLRQMGYFEALSDDFNAQYLRAPQGRPMEAPQ